MTPPRYSGPGGLGRMPLGFEDALDEQLVFGGEGDSNTSLLAAVAARALDSAADIARYEPVPDPITVGDLARMGVPVPEPPVLDALFRQLPEHERGVLGRVALAHAMATDPARLAAARGEIATSLNRYQQIIVLAAARAEATSDGEILLAGGRDSELLAFAERQRSFAGALTLLQTGLGEVREQLVRLDRPDQAAGVMVGEWSRIFEESCETLASLLAATERVSQPSDPEGAAALQGLVARLGQAATAAERRFREQGFRHTEEVQLTGMTYLRAVRTLTRALPAPARPAAPPGADGGLRLTPPAVQVPAGGRLAL